MAKNNNSMEKAKSAKKRKVQPKTSEEFLEEIRKLMVLYLYKNNVSTQEIGETLGYSYKVIENMLPKTAKRKSPRGRK